MARLRLPEQRIAAGSSRDDVRRFLQLINTDHVFSTHTPGAHNALENYTRGPTAQSLPKTCKGCAWSTYASTQSDPCQDHKALIQRPHGRRFSHEFCLSLIDRQASPTPCDHYQV